MQAQPRSRKVRSFNEDNPRKIHAVRYPWCEWDWYDEYAHRSITHNSIPASLQEPDPTRSEMGRNLLSLDSSHRCVIEFRHPLALGYNNPDNDSNDNCPWDIWWDICNQEPPMYDGYYCPIPLTNEAVFPVRNGNRTQVGGSDSYLWIDDLDVYENFTWSPSGNPTWSLKEGNTSGVRYSVRRKCNRTYIYRGCTHDGDIITSKYGVPNFILRRRRGGEIFTAVDEKHFQPWTWTDQTRPEWSEVPEKQRLPGCDFETTDYEGPWCAFNHDYTGILGETPFISACENELTPPPNCTFNLAISSVYLGTENMAGVDSFGSACYASKSWTDTLSGVSGVSGGCVDIRDILEVGREFTMVVNCAHYEYARYEDNGTTYVKLSGTDYEDSQSIMNEIEYNVPRIMELTETGYAGAYGQVLFIV
jgi:hypothetical protein